MDNLAERIKASIEDPTGELWFPELTADLATRAWESLQRDIGLTPDSYGTERVLSRSLSTPRVTITSLKTSPSTCATPSAIAIEALSPESAIKYREQGVSFYSADEILQSTILLGLEDALVIINQVPSLMRTIATLVRSLHVIRPEDEDYDVSFSEPHIPFSIFVSVPERRISNDALRVAEAIVHEAMHLQLTLIQHMTPLLDPTSNKYYSPWKREFRDAEGVLQALYVFKIIHDFLRALNATFIDANEEQKISKRLSAIRSQIGNVRGLRGDNALTSTGARLVYWLTDRGLEETCSPTASLVRNTHR
jgi:hypothetical protein